MTVPADPSFSSSSIPSSSPSSAGSSPPSSTPAPHRLLDFGRARHGEHDRVGRLSAAGIARCLSWPEPGRMGDLGGGIDLPGARLCAARGFPAGERRSLRLHTASVRRSRGVPGRMGLLDLNLDRQRRARGRLCRLSRPVHPINRAQSSRRGIAGRRDGLASDRRQLPRDTRRGPRAARDDDAQGPAPAPRRNCRRDDVRAIALFARRRRGRHREGRHGDRDADAVGVRWTRKRDGPGREHRRRPPHDPARDDRRHAAGGRALPAQHRRRHEPAGSRDPGEVDRALCGRGSCARRRCARQRSWPSAPRFRVSAR